MQTPLFFLGSRRPFPSTKRAPGLVFLALLSFAAAAQPSTPPPPPGGVPSAKIYGKDVPGWIAHLRQHEVPGEQERAVYCLGEFGPAAAAAVPALRTRLSPHYDPVLRRLAIEALGYIGEAAASARGELLALLADRKVEAALRKSACTALARIAPADPRVRRALLKAVGDREKGVRHAALDAAVTLYSFSPKVVNVLHYALYRREDAETAALGLRCLGQKGVAPLAQALASSRDSHVRLVAARALRRIGPPARGARQVLLRAARRDRSAEVRAVVFAILAERMPTDPEALEALAEGLGAAGLSTAAEEALRRCETAALRVLRKALHGKKAARRAAALRVLDRLGRPAADLLDDLIAALQDKNPAVSLAAARTLGDLGPAAAGAASALRAFTRRTKDPAAWRAGRLAAANVKRPPGTRPFRSPLEAFSTPRVLEALAQGLLPERRMEAARALRRRKGVGVGVAAVAGPALAKALKDPDLRVRVAAAESLAFFGKYARAGVPVLLDWLGSADARLQRAALTALTGIGAQAPEALVPLVSFAKSPATDDEKMRALAGLALRPHAPRAGTWLTSGLKDPDPKARQRIARVIRQIGPAAATALPALLEAAQGSGDTLAHEALLAVGAMGSTARSAVPVLLKLMTHVQPERRMVAAWTLGDIGLDPAAGDPHGVLDALIVALLDPKEDVARAAHVALAAIGASALPRLRELLKIGEGEAPYWALRVMARMKADPSTVIPRLLELLRPGKRSLERGTAAELLGYYAPEHSEIIPGLVRVLGDREDFVARAAGRTLQKFRGDAVPALRSVLRGRDPRARHRALDVLEQLETRP